MGAEEEERSRRFYGRGRGAPNAEAEGAPRCRRGRTLSLTSSPGLITWQRAGSASPTDLQYNSGIADAFPDLLGRISNIHQALCDC